jgi:hypothetical protein
MLTLVRDMNIVRAIPGFVLDQRGIKRFALPGPYSRGGSSISSDDARFAQATAALFPIERTLRETISQPG